MTAPDDSAAAPNIELRVLDPRLHAWGLPNYQSEQAAGIDLRACIGTPIEIRPQAPALLVPTGLALHMDSNDYFAMVVPRSGLGHKLGLVLGNGTGIIDADYLAECFVSVWNRNPAQPDAAPIVIEPGERIAQMLFLPVLRPRFQLVEEFSRDSARGLGGFGSTGR